MGQGHAGQHGHHSHHGGDGIDVSQADLTPRRISLPPEDTEYAEPTRTLSGGASGSGGRRIKVDAEFIRLQASKFGNQGTALHAISEDLKVVHVKPGYFAEADDARAATHALRDGASENAFNLGESCRAIREVLLWIAERWNDEEAANVADSGVPWITLPTSLSSVTPVAGFDESPDDAPPTGDFMVADPRDDPESGDDYEDDYNRLPATDGTADDQGSSDPEPSDATLGEGGGAGAAP